MLIWAPFAKEIKRQLYNKPQTVIALKNIAIENGIYYTKFAYTCFFFTGGEVFSEGYKDENYEKIPTCLKGNKQKSVHKQVSLLLQAFSLKSS